MTTDDYLEHHVFPHAGNAWPQAVLLLVLMLAAGMLSVFLAGRDVNWDLANYHYYNPYALLTGRFGHDLAPAQMQTYLNPLLDVPFYLMVSSGWPAKLVAFAMGLPAGVATFFLAKALTRFFDRCTPTLRLTLVLLGIAIGVTGASAVAVLGSTMNEWPGAALVLAAVWCTLPRADGTTTARAAMVAGVLAGIACGFKLTAAPFALGIAAALVARGGGSRQAWRSVAMFAAAAVAGCLLSGGYWMWKLWSLYDSPVFPFFNQWLQSPWFEPQSIVPRIFGPMTLAQWLTFPLPLLGDTRMYVSEQVLRDWRLPLLYLLAIAAFVAWAWRRQFGSPAPEPVARADAARYVGAFVAVSVLAWAAVYGVYRYLVPVEMLSGALILYLLSTMVSRAGIRAAAVAAAVVAICNVTYPQLGHRAFDGPYIEARVPPLAPGTMVLLADAEPTAWVAPFLPADARLVGINNNIANPMRQDRMQQRVTEAVATHRGPLVAISFPPGSDIAPTLAAYGLQRDGAPCRPITGNVLGAPIDLCGVQRAAR